MRNPRKSSAQIDAECKLVAAEKKQVNEKAQAGIRKVAHLEEAMHAQDMNVSVAHPALSTIKKVTRPLAVEVIKDGDGGTDNDHVVLEDDSERKVRMKPPGLRSAVMVECTKGKRKAVEEHSMSDSGAAKAAQALKAAAIFPSGLASDFRSIENSLKSTSTASAMLPMFPASSNAHDSPTPSYNPSGSREAIVDDDGHSEDEGDANFRLLYGGYEDEDEDAEHAAASGIRTRDMETNIGFDGGAEYADGQEIQAELEAPSLTINFGGPTRKLQGPPPLRSHPAAKKKATVQADSIALPPPSQTQQATVPKLSSATQPPQSQQATSRHSVVPRLTQMQMATPRRDAVSSAAQPQRNLPMPKTVTRRARTQQAAVQEDTATHIARARVPVVASGHRRTQHFDESDADDEASDSMELIVIPIPDVTIVHTLPSPTQPLHPPAVGEPAVVYANANLPAGTQARWRCVFVPSWRESMGTLINPWDTSDMDSDKAYETAGERAEYAAWAIGYHVPFLWGSIDNTDPMNLVFSEAFQTPWVYMVFAHHLSALGGLASEYMSHKMPVGALVLTAVALERALSMWTTGNLKRHDVKSENTFSETNWGEKSAEYSLSIQQLPAASWEVIKMNSLKYMRSHKGGTLIRASEAVAAGNLSVRGSIVDRDRYQE
ncbi:hypothetical protein EW146_g2494 [Bondarzewia mesenterica]|uniref:Uncharacterized protein n=1 Tax=Bondarzewia mesenterica TaxID=1095465 RepID=A0A4S4M0E9_9AGAM|nr:hypothetical protein EW146_g2494 [Bondarzewia mesenterica]